MHLAGHHGVSEIGSTTGLSIDTACSMKFSPAFAGTHDEDIRKGAANITGLLDPIARGVKDNGI